MLLRPQFPSASVLNTIIDMGQAVVVIPFRAENQSRTEIIPRVVTFILSRFDVNMVVVETGPTKVFNLDAIRSMFFTEYPKGRTAHKLYIEHQFIPATDHNFRKNTLINTGVHEALRRIPEIRVCVPHDADCLVTKEQYIEAYNLSLSGAPFTFPFGHRTVAVDDWKERTFNGVADLRAWVPSGRLDVQGVEGESLAPSGVLFIRHDAYQDIGYENENFVNYTHEDVERITRAKILGYEFRRVPGSLFHLTHERGSASHWSNPHYEAGVALARRIAGMTCNEVRAYIQTMNDSR